ncbi:hypothetical protein GCM10010435_05250 [Winogradskya consettensis]|uniref:Uncharacterized protein n=2 Tax=Winogradskya consettensis TaxID=113560 RepID=A0A919SVT6_9ACTN|nr:hypothetical protein Aco04nite_66120 [Actinoplanes consettensis]
MAGEELGFGYPVLDSAELEPIKRRMFRRPRRELHEIPRQPPGSVLVFQLGDSYEVLPDTSLRLDAELVVDAVAVAVVSTRQVQREAVAYLPSADPRTCVAVRAVFFCLVTDAQLVLDAGCWDVGPLLSDHLSADPRLRFLTQSTDLHAGWPHFQRNATARLLAYHEMHPLIVAGLTVRLTDVAFEPQRLATLPQQQGRTVQAAPRPEEDGAPGEMGETGEMPMADGDPAIMRNYTWGENRE